MWNAIIKPTYVDMVEVCTTRGQARGLFDGSYLILFFLSHLVVSIGPPVHMRAGLVVRLVWSGLG